MAAVLCAEEGEPRKVTQLGHIVYAKINIVLTATYSKCEGLESTPGEWVWNTRRGISHGDYFMYIHLP